MGHDWCFVGRGAAGPLGLGWPTLLILGLLALVVLVVIASLLSRRQGDPARSERQREVYENMDGQINSMLLQAGGPLTQDAICESLGVPVAVVADTLAAMEKRREIGREWLPAEYTYLVRRATANSEPSASGTKA